MSRYHGNDEPCAFCGVKYREFRTGLTYRDVFMMHWSYDEDTSTWQYKTRRKVLGRWFAYKQEMWKMHKYECELYLTPQAVGA